MNTEWAAADLDKFIEQTDMSNASSSPDGAVYMTSRNNIAASDADVTKQAQVIEKIFDRVLPGLRTDIHKSKNNRWNQHGGAAIRAREELIRKQEVKENLGDNAPELSAAQLHLWAWSGASSLWQSGHFREAV